MYIVSNIDMCFTCLSPFFSCKNMHYSSHGCYGKVIMKVKPSTVISTYKVGGHRKQNKKI